MSNDRRNTGKGKFNKDSQRNRPKSKMQQKPKANVKKTTSDEIRLNKYIANSGMCSRREADMHISIGSVTVNGKVVTETCCIISIIGEVLDFSSIVRISNTLFRGASNFF